MKIKMCRTDDATTYDEDLCRIVEPNVETTYERFRALEILRDNGIPTVVWLFARYCLL